MITGLQALSCDTRAFELFRTGGGPVSAALLNDWSVRQDASAVLVRLDGGYLLSFAPSADGVHSSPLEIFEAGKPIAFVEGNGFGSTKSVDGPGPTGFVLSDTATFVLRDSTKITVHMVRQGGAFYLDSVLVTKGDKSLVVGGMAPQAGSTLQVAKGMNGRALDAALSDGQTRWTERDDGRWIDQAGELVGAFGATSGLDASALPSAPELSVCAQFRIAEACVQTTCFSWLEALAAALGGNLSRQVDKISALYKAVNFCNGVKAGCVVSKEEYLAFCKNAADCGLEFKGNGWTQNADGTYTAGEAASTECGNIQQTLQTMLTASAQQFQLLATMNSTVLNSISQGMQTIARAG